MAFTRYKRKDRKNKAVSRQRKQLLKLNSTIITVESPNKDRVVILED
jgi:reverse gyrase